MSYVAGKRYYSAKDVPCECYIAHVYYQIFLLFLT